MFKDLEIAEVAMEWWAARNAALSGTGYEQITALGFAEANLSAACGKFYLLNPTPNPEDGKNETC